MKKSLLVATKNRGKVKEYSDMLNDLGVNWLSLKDVGITLEVEETGATFEENAILKATRYAEKAGCLTLADDSGLEVDALEGNPGIYTARYGGEGLTYAQRYTLLLSNLAQVPEEQRTARFRCVIALANKDGKLIGIGSGTLEGNIAFAPKGDHGFGYDPVFIVPELGETLAQLEAEQKHAISHRGRALKDIEPLIRKVLA